jgi:hypothetical protein
MTDPPREWTRIRRRAHDVDSDEAARAFSI